MDKVVSYTGLKTSTYEKKKVSEVSPTDIYQEIKEAYISWRKPKRLAAGNPYDLIITDMWYSPERGSGEQMYGNRLIEIAKKEHWDVPILICSRQDYSTYPGIRGSLHYSDNVDWESKLRNYVEEIKKEK